MKASSTVSQPLYAAIFMLLIVFGCKPGESTTELPTRSKVVTMKEKHRPQFHFSPPANWMNDPNGMVYHNGEYHLFYQYYPDSTVWGPMHWGHAVSKNMIDWQHLPVALYPDSLGYIFSGSAVVDSKNTSGLGSSTVPPLVAIYTYHQAEKEKAGSTNYQYQGIASSTDDGRTWTKYSQNPVLPNQGIKDFRDPKVFWHNASSKWVMALAVSDHIEFWESSDLKSWNKLSDFGTDFGAHGGVWECPDLFEVGVEGTGSSKWVLFVSINPGGPNGGSATQYFTGSFDGKTFSAEQDKGLIRWVDYGPDNYAGVTWNNAPDNRKIFFGWMSNWAYGQVVPTQLWRSANTLPRDLSLVKVNGMPYLKSTFSKEITALHSSNGSIPDQEIPDSIRIAAEVLPDASQAMVAATLEAKDFAWVLSNKLGQQVRIGFDASKNQFYIDRSQSGDLSFSESFGNIATAPRVVGEKTIRMTMVMDVSSVEVLFDNGVTVMTAIYFPDEPLTNLSITAESGVKIKDVELHKMRSIWNGFKPMTLE